MLSYMVVTMSKMACVVDLQYLVESHIDLELQQNVYIYKKKKNFC